MKDFLDKLFITLTKEMIDIHRKGLCETDIYTTSCSLVDDFSRLALSLAKDGCNANLIDLELSFNMSKL